MFLSLLIAFLLLSMARLDFSLELVIECVLKDKMDKIWLNQIGFIAWI
jgi:hypothetical protein